MDRFRTTLCLNGVRTADNTPLHVVNAQTLSLSGKLINADDIVERALPSKVATAIESSMAAAPAYAPSVFFLLGAQVHHGRLGDAVVNYIIRDQAQHRTLLYDRQVSHRPVVTVPMTTARAGAEEEDERPLRYEECLLFAYDNGAVACETLRATDTADTVDKVLSSLRVISFAAFKYAKHKTCILLVGTHLSTAHMAALLLASRRHVFLYVDTTMTAHDVAATTEEMRQVQQSLSDFALPLDEDVQEVWGDLAAAAAHAQASPSHSVSSHPTLPVSRMLDALARSAEEYDLLRMTLALERNGGDSGRAAARVEEAERRAAMATLQRHVREARAAQKAAEADLEEQRQAHRAEILALRAELQHLEEERVAWQSMSANGESLNDGGRGIHNGRSHVSQNLLHSLQQQSQSHLYASSAMAESSATVAELQRKLQDALMAQKFAEEKVHLLELRESMRGGTNSGAMSVLKANASGSVVSPRPSLRLPAASAAGTAMINAADAPSWEQSLLQQENTALVAEFQRKEKEWQQRLRHASNEVAQLRQEKAAMEATLQMQSKTIAAAQQALIDTREVQEQKMRQVLQRVRTLSQESRSRHSSHATSAPRSSAGGASDVVSAISPLPAPNNCGGDNRTPPSPPQPRQHSATLSAASSRKGGMMSPTR